MDVDLQKAEGSEGAQRNQSGITTACTRLIGLYASGDTNDIRERMINDRLRDRYTSKFNLAENKELEKLIFANRNSNDCVFQLGSRSVEFSKLSPLLPVETQKHLDCIPPPQNTDAKRFTTPMAAKQPAKPPITPAMPPTNSSMYSRVPVPSQPPPAQAAVPNANGRQKRKIDDIEEMEEPEKKSMNDFQTAKDKLADDAIKKGSKPKPIGNKKTLGGRPVGRGGFVIPKKKVEEDEEDEDDVVPVPAPTVKKVNSNAITHPTNKKEPPNNAAVSEENPNGLESVNGVPLTDERLRQCEPRMIELIMNEILDKGPAVHWDDIAGLEKVKKIIYEIVVWPILQPKLFTGLRTPPRGALLFGPPGTGKTMLGKAIATNSKSTFFNISASSLTSKWIGEGEKMVRALFGVARCFAPSVIFVDEIDSLLIQRSEGENEATRRLKTEFLIQWDGAASRPQDRLLLVGATNRPQELDEAARRRLVKRVYIPLPDHEARVALIKNVTKGQTNLTEEEVELLARKTEGYSGSDLHNACKEAALGPIRELEAEYSMTDTIIDDSQVRPINFSDCEKALTQVRSSVSHSELLHYTKFDDEFGSK